MYLTFGAPITAVVWGLVSLYHVIAITLAEACSVRQSFLSEDWHCRIDCWQIQCYSLTFNDLWQLRQAGKPDFACNFLSCLQLGSSRHFSTCLSLQAAARKLFKNCTSWHALMVCVVQPDRRCCRSLQLCLIFNVVLQLTAA